MAICFCLTKRVKEKWASRNLIDLFDFGSNFLFSGESGVNFKGFNWIMFRKELEDGLLLKGVFI